MAALFCADLIVLTPSAALSSATHQCHFGTSRRGCNSASVVVLEFWVATCEPKSTCDFRADRKASSAGNPALSAAFMNKSTNRWRWASVMGYPRWTSMRCRNPPISLLNRSGPPKLSAGSEGRESLHMTRFFVSEKWLKQWVNQAGMVEYVAELVERIPPARVFIQRYVVTWIVWFHAYRLYSID